MSLEIHVFMSDVGEPSASASRLAKYSLRLESSDGLKRYEAGAFEVAQFACLPLVAKLPLGNASYTSEMRMSVRGHSPARQKIESQEALPSGSLVTRKQGTRKSQIDPNPKLRNFESGSLRSRNIENLPKRLGDLHHSIHEKYSARNIRDHFCDEYFSCNCLLRLLMISPHSLRAALYPGMVTLSPLR